MPRLPRPQIPDGIYHVTCRGVRKLSICRDTDDRETFLEILGVVVAKFAWTCLDYCEMTSRCSGQSRYASEFIQTQEHLALLYMGYSPVEAGLCVDPADWPYSGIGASLGRRAAPEFLHTGSLLDLLGMRTTTQLAELIYADARLPRAAGL